MSFRVSALVAVALALGSVAPAFAQPQAPLRPRSSPFGNVFTPGPAALTPPGQGAFGFGPAGGGLLVAPGFVNPNLVGGTPGLGYPGQTLPGAFAVNPPPASSGGAVFNNLGHWYGGNYGNWYRNGVTSGYGVLGSSAAVGGAGGAGPQRSGGPIRSGAGTALMAGAAAGQFRR